MPDTTPQIVATSNRAVQVAGTWLAIASCLMIALLTLHGPLAPDIYDQMAKIAGHATRWAIVHWIAAAALSLFAATALIVLNARSRLTNGGWTLTAWAVLPIGALWTQTTAVVEATVVAHAAEAGSAEVFESWWMFAEGMGHGIAFVALAVALIAGNEARSAERATPAWSAWLGMLAGVASFFGWALGMWFEVAFGNFLWVLSTIAMSVWTLWFGVALIRSGAE